jgi:signal transduction histidine kinase
MSDADTATLLIVEDDPATGAFLADNLTADGYEVLVAEHVRDGLRMRSTRSKPDPSGTLVARTCHEVRGPLTALGLAVAGMDRRGEAPVRCLAALEVELTRAAAAIEDLVCAGRGRRTLDRLEAVELDALLRAAVAAWTVGGHAVRLEPVGETWLLADRVRLARAVANLVPPALTEIRSRPCR